MCIRGMDDLALKEFGCLWVIEKMKGFVVFEFGSGCNEEILRGEWVNFFGGLDDMVKCF